MEPDYTAWQPFDVTGQGQNQYIAFAHPSTAPTTPYGYYPSPDELHEFSFPVPGGGLSHAENGAFAQPGQFCQEPQFDYGGHYAVQQSPISLPGAAMPLLSPDSVQHQVSPRGDEELEPELILGAGIGPPTASYKRRRGEREPSASASPEASTASPEAANDERNRERNRRAANKCRQRSKQYVEELKAREQVLTAQKAVLKENVASLREEVVCLKTELLRHSQCDCDFIQRYLQKAARQVS